MSRKKYNQLPEPLALKFVKILDSAYPMLWTVYDGCLKRYQSQTDADAKYLTLPICKNLYSVISKPYTTNAADISIDICTIHSIGAWRPYKQIYSFNSDTADVLINHNSENISGETLKLLKNTPYPAFYVECEKIPNGGFFYVYESYNNTARFFTIGSDGTDGVAMGFRLNGDDLQSAIKERIKNAEDSTKAQEVFDSQHEFLINAIQLVLYLASINCDIEENPQQKTVYKPNKSGQHLNKISEVRKWDVGFRVSKTLRNNRLNTHICISNHGVSSTKRPHIRRGHYHRFWTGHRDGERIAVLKWVAPAYVNMTAEEMPAVVNII